MDIRAQNKPQDALKPSGSLAAVGRPITEEAIFAVKRVLAREFEVGMQNAHLTKAAMAKRMGTTRSQLDRLLNPANPSATLQTLVRAAGAVGKRVKISLVTE